MNIVEQYAVIETSGKIYKGTLKGNETTSKANRNSSGGRVMQMIISEEHGDVGVDDWDMMYADDGVRGLARLRRRIRAAIDRYQREMARYRRECMRAFYYKDIVLNLNNSVGKHFVSSMRTSGSASSIEDSHWTRKLSTRWEWIWKCRVRTIAYKMASVFSLLLSLAIVIAQVTIVAGGNGRYSSIMYTFAVATGPGITFVSLLLLLLYCCCCCYYTLFQLATFDFNMLVLGHTQGTSMSSNALLICRVSSPIAFNFINMTHVKGTAFDRNIGDAIDGTPVLGKKFNGKKNHDDGY